jgi:hypothetical protein
MTPSSMIPTRYPPPGFAKAVTSFGVNRVAVAVPVAVSITRIPGPFAGKIATYKVPAAEVIAPVAAGRLIGPTSSPFDVTTLGPESSRSNPRGTTSPVRVCSNVTVASRDPLVIETTRSLRPAATANLLPRAASSTAATPVASGFVSRLRITCPD